MTVETPCQSAPDLWFSEVKEDRQYAKQTCYTSCPIRLQCLELAKRLEPRPNYGIWGGYHARTVQKMAAA